MWEVMAELLRGNKAASGPKPTLPPPKIFNPKLSGGVETWWASWIQYMRAMTTPEEDYPRFLPPFLDHAVTNIILQNLPENPATKQKV